MSVRSGVPRKPRLLLEAQIERRLYWRRFRFSLLVLVVVMLALVALRLAGGRITDQLSPAVLDVGRLAALVLSILLFLRVMVNLSRWLTRRDEHIRIFDQGLMWSRNGSARKYGWDKLRVLREQGHGLYLGKRPLVQWGGHTLKMADGEVYRFAPYHGDLRQFIRVVRPFAAEATGERMARMLREEKPIRLHPRLTVWPGGVEIGKQELPWGLLDVRVSSGRLMIRQRDDKGKYRVVRRYPVGQVDNVGGFLELATTTIQTHR